MSLPPDEKLASCVTPFQRFFSLTRPELPTLAAGTLFLALSSAAGLVVPRLTGRIIDAAMAANVGLARLDHLALLLLAAFTVEGGASALRFALFTLSGERVVACLRRDPALLPTRPLGNPRAPGKHGAARAPRSRHRRGEPPHRPAPFHPVTLAKDLPGPSSAVECHARKAKRRHALGLC
jgi:hypothetical protein